MDQSDPIDPLDVIEIDDSLIDAREHHSIDDCLFVEVPDAPTEADDEHE